MIMQSNIHGLTLAEKKIKHNVRVAKWKKTLNKLLNKLVVWFFILVIGISLGYSWRMQQESNWQKSNQIIMEN